MVKKNIRRRKKRKPVRKIRHSRFKFFFRRFVLATALIFAFILLCYLGYLDYMIKNQFEGKRWAIPANVYASPVELYAGNKWNISSFEELLHRLQYRKDYQLSSPGTYFRLGKQINVYTRNFAFWDKRQSGKRLRFFFANNSIEQIVNIDQQTDVAIVRMEPEKIGSFYPTRKEDRILIKLSQAPDTLLQGLLSTEDRNFYNHFGVSVKAIARALWANIRARKVVQGGSTITQQLVKNFFLSSKRTLGRKINEALMAFILDARYSKNEIMEAYLNEVYLGQDGARSINGFGLASQFYFGRSIERLALHQVATLVALVRGPSYYDPDRYPNRAIKRRNRVLDAMMQQNFITAKQSLQAKQEPLEIVIYRHQSVNRYPDFLDLVKRQLRQEYKEKDLTSDGLRIFTTLDTQIQDLLENKSLSKLNYLEKSSKVNKLQTAAIVTRREGGEIVAMNGHRKNLGVGFNRALDALRPIGSLMKPVVYLTALELSNRYTISTHLSDTKIRIKGKKDDIWEPRNYGKKEHGLVELHTALANSYNLATVHLGMDIGIARTAKTLNALGVSRPVNLYPSLFLGATRLTPLEVTQIYQTLAGDGFATPLRAIRAVVSLQGEALQNYPLTIRQAVDPGATFIVNTILQEAMQTGTGKTAYKKLPRDLMLVGKTGTSNDLDDSWFAGFSGDYLSVVWIGRDDNRSSGLTGATGALQIWTDLMKDITQEPVILIAPDNVEMILIDPQTGLRANEECKGVKTFPYIVGSGPKEYSSCVESPFNKAKTWFKDFFDQKMDIIQPDSN
ncbi:MAG: penicillin-binding protein 1B [Methylococcaceae bacterium]